MDIIRLAVLAAAVLLAVSACKRSEEHGPMGRYGGGADTSAVTADDQALNSEANNQLVADIRKEILDDDSLSTAAHNIVIVSSGPSKVTLRGGVANQAERDKVVVIARRHASDIIDEMTLP